MIAGAAENFRQRGSVGDIDLLHQLQPDMTLQPADQVIEPGELRLYPRLHQGVIGGDEQVHDGFFRAAQAGAVAAGKA